VFSRAAKQQHAMKRRQYVGRQSVRDQSRMVRELSVPSGMSRMYSADPVDRRMANAFFREVPEDDEEDEDDRKEEEEEDDEEGEGYSE
jgi:hypothetical protein